MWHPTVDQALQTTRFYQISRIGEIKELSALLVALVMVTLKDVVHIYRLPIDRGCDRMDG
ncbi:hypothetical protein AHAS_Ahas15G0244900 [Arachis hypogaea]